MKIFVGSSSEAEQYDVEIRKILENHPDITPISWKDEFTPGEFGLESLERIKKEVDASIIIASSDDKVWYRGTEAFAPRDNVLFELGLFISQLGKERVALILVENEKGEKARIPTDLAGLNQLDYVEGKSAGNEVALTKWLLHLKREIGNKGAKLNNPFEILQEQYGRLPETWKDDVKNYIIEPFRKQSLNALSGEFSLNLTQYYNSLFTSISNSELGSEIRAISVLSHDFWENDPFQIQYLSYNIEASNREVRIKRLFVVNHGVNSGLWKTIQKQLDNGIEVRTIDSKTFSKFSMLEDMVIIETKNDYRSYISKQFFSNTNRLKSANLNLNTNYCQEQILSFDAIWKLGVPPKPSVVNKYQGSRNPPGENFDVISLNKEVVTCAEAAEARGVKLCQELKTLILKTVNGFIAVHIPADGEISLRAIKNALDIRNASIAPPEELYKMGLSPGTVSAVLDPVWSMPHLISKRVLTQDFVTTNNGTKSQYFKFDPISLLDAENYLLGQFEK